MPGESPTQFNNEPDAGSQAAVRGIVIQGILHMNRPSVSVLGTGAAFVAGSVASWLAAKNLLPTADVSMATTVFGDLGLALAGVAVAYLKATMVTKAATLAAANAHIANGTAVVIAPAHPADSPTVVPVAKA